MSFLAILDDEYNILEVKWSDPVYLVMQENKNLKSLIIEEEISLLEDYLKETVNDIHISKHEYHFIDYDKLQTFFSKRNNSKILIFGCSDFKSLSPEFIKIIKRFMITFKEDCEQDKFLTTESIRYNFEKIQTLNSKLVVAERQLAKKNSQLKKMNLVLNNRLVKDALTGLVSKYQYRDEIAQMIEDNPDKFGVFMFIDIDDFKNINDTYGHSVGDEYLIEFANRLRSLPIENTIHLRIAGDEFGLFTYGLTKVDENYKQRYWEIIKENIISKPFEIKGKQLTFSFSGGIAVYGIDTTEIYELIEYADIAMYEAKKSGKNKMASFKKIGGNHES